VAGAFRRAGLAVPEIQIDRNWNEFDLDMVYQAIAPRLSAEDPEFQAEHEKLLRQLHDDNSPVHRAWTQCDTLVVRAWVEGRYEVPGESWEAFRERVCRPLETLKRFLPGDTIAIFSSATPIAVWIGMALGLNARHTLRLAGVTYNAALTTMRVREDDLALFTFNIGVEVESIHFGSLYNVQRGTIKSAKVHRLVEPTAKNRLRPRAAPLPRSASRRCPAWP